MNISGSIFLFSTLFLFSILLQLVHGREAVGRLHLGPLLGHRSDVDHRSAPVRLYATYPKEKKGKLPVMVFLGGMMGCVLI
jgi:hypothetical protein